MFGERLILSPECLSPFIRTLPTFIIYPHAGGSSRKTASRTSPKSDRRLPPADKDKIEYFCTSAKSTDWHYQCRVRKLHEGGPPLVSHSLLIFLSVFAAVVFVSGQPPHAHIPGLMQPLLHVAHVALGVTPHRPTVASPVHLEAAFIVSSFKN